MSLTEKNLHVIFEEPPSLYLIVSFGEHFPFLLLNPEEIRAKPKLKKPPLCEKYPNTEFFWSLFSRIWTEYRVLRSKSPYSKYGKIRARKKSVFEHFLRGAFNRIIFIKSWASKFNEAMFREILLPSWEKYLSKRCLIKHTRLWRDEIIIFWTLNKQAKRYLRRSYRSSHPEVFLKKGAPEICS